MRTLILLGILCIFACGRKNIVVNTLEFPAGEILQIKGTDTIEYPSFEDATIISGYDSLTIINSINNGTNVDGYQFSNK